jgi:hypothetical protein
MSRLTRKIWRNKMKLKYIELVEDVGCIPKGIYELIEKDSLFYHFVVGDAGIFGVSRDAEVKVYRDLPNFTPVDPKIFIDRYYELMRREQERPSPPGGPFTFGFVSTEYGHEVN